jgi:hypothetical protein
MEHAHAHAVVCLCNNSEGECHCHDAGTDTHTHGKRSFGARVKPYTSLIITLVGVLIFGVVLSFVIGFSWLSVMEYWMGGYFLAFGLLQALSLKKSAAMFRQYDPLAMRLKAYSYALPFIQIGLGVAYFLMVWWVAVGLIALMILMINAVGVNNVMKQKQTVRCGCLGESMNVPVGNVTLWENLIMIGMVIMMLVIHTCSYFLISYGADVNSMPGMSM